MGEEPRCRCMATLRFLWAQSKGIIDQAEMTVEEFVALLRGKKP